MVENILEKLARGPVSLYWRLLWNRRQPHLCHG